MGKIFQEGRSMVGCSSGIISEMFSVVHIVTVHTVYFSFIASVCCDLFFSLGPEVKAIILNIDFSFGLSLSSQVFQSFWFQN